MLLVRQRKQVPGRVALAGWNATPSWKETL
jgi:hypothetical protein